MKRLICVLVLILSACAPLPMVDGQIEALQPATTLRGVEMALKSAPGTVVLEKGSLQILGWSQSGGWGWACLKCGDQTTLLNAMGGKGNVGTARTFGDLVRFLKENGWTTISPTVVTGAQSIAVWISQNVSGLTILVLPVVPEEFETKKS